MPKIISFGLYKTPEKENPLKATWESFNSMEKFTRFMVISFFLFILSTPFIINNPQIFYSRAQEKEVVYSEAEISAIITKNNESLQKLGIENIISVASNSCSSIPIQETIEKPDPNNANTKVDLSIASELTLGLTKASSVYVNASGSQKPQLENQINKLARSRKLLFMQLMRSDPDTALSLVISLSPEDELKAIVTPVNCIETPATIEGELEIIHADFFEDNVSVEQYTLVVSGKRVRIHPAGGTEKLITSGMKLKVKGFRLDDDVLVDGSDPQSIIVLPKGSSSKNPFIQEVYADHTEYHTQIQQEARGEQRTLVFMINFQNTTPPANITHDEVQDLVFNQMEQYYIENSYGKIPDISGDVYPATGWITLPIDKTCSGHTTEQEAIKQMDSSVDFSQYERLILLVPTMTGCGFGGMASFGKTTVNTEEGIVFLSISWNVSFGLGTFGHEFGHNLGVNHAGFIGCNDAPISPVGCPYFSEYGDYYNIMGVSVYKWYMNAPHKDYLGWFDSSNIQTITTSGTYVLEPLETTTAGLKALKISRGVATLRNSLEEDFLFLEYRQPIGFDIEPFTSSIYDGVLFHSMRSPYQSLILDMTPATPVALYDPLTLLINESFSDYANGVNIIPVAKDENSLTIQIEFDSLDLVGGPVLETFADFVPGEKARFSSIIQNSGVQTNLNTHHRLRLDLGNNGTWDIQPTKVATEKIAEGGSAVATWQEEGWVWLQNGNSTTASSPFVWFPVAVVPSDADGFAFGVWASWDEEELSGNEGNYNVFFDSNTCFVDKGPWEKVYRTGIGCVVISDLNSDAVFDDNYSLTWPPFNHCDIRYSAATRAIEFRDTNELRDCGFAIFTHQPIWKATSGTHKVEVCADAPNHLKESDETNNCVTQTFTVAGPDLTINLLKPSPERTPVGRLLDFTARVRNVGAGSLNGSSTLQLRLDVNNDGTWDTQPSDIAFGPLAESASETKTWIDVWEATEGTHKIEVCADVVNAVQEEKETNNCLSTIFTVPAIDFLIASFELTPAIPKIGDVMSFSADIKNEGEGNLSMNTRTRLRLDINTDGKWDMIKSQTTRTPASSTIETKQWKDVWTAVAGTHKAEVCADSTDLIFEPKESNNCFASTFTVSLDRVSPCGDLGDVNGNGFVTQEDVDLILQHIVQSRILSDSEFARADVTRNGAVNILDSTEVLQYIGEQLAAFSGCNVIPQPPKS